MENRRKLSSVFIDSEFQGKFLTLFGGFTLLLMILFFYMIHFIMEQVIYFMDQQPGENVEVINQLYVLKANFFAVFGISFTLIILLFLYTAFRFTHKIAGAVFHFKKSFNEMATEGQVKEICLRDGDFLRDLEASYNNMVRKIKS